MLRANFPVSENLVNRRLQLSTVAGKTCRILGTQNGTSDYQLRNDTSNIITINEWSRSGYQLDHPPYFLIAVSNRENLDLCRRHGLAGLTNTFNGAWGFSDIPIGSRISFLYGAQAHDLYVVKDKYCITDWQTAPPWKPLEFRSKLTYGFPFRFQLERLRKFEYPLATDKFLYVATNLMLRGGYRKTHFQADATNLGNASEIGEPSRTPVEVLGYDRKTFELRFRKAKKSDERPIVFPIREIILQAAIRNHLSHEANMESFLELTNLTGFEPSSLEALGEKALPQGYVDVLLKNANPTGDSKKILIEVKLKKATTENFSQLEAYMQEVGADCGGGILVAESFGKSRPVISGIKCVRYELRGLSDTFTFDEFVSSLRFDLVS